MSNRRTVALLRVSTAEQDLGVQRGQVNAWATAHGVTVDRFVVKPKSGGKGRVYYVHLGTGLLHRMDVYSTAWVRWLSIYCTDWRNAGGLNRPYKLTIWDRDKDKLLQTWEYKSIRKS